MKEEKKVKLVKPQEWTMQVPAPGVTIHHDCEKTLFVDVDKTLVFFDIPPEKEKEVITFTSFGFEKRILPHWHHVEIIKQFRARGIGVFVWSAGGARWAAAVVDALGLTGWVNGVLPKPDWYLDDKDVSSWMGQRFYLDITTGQDLFGKKKDDVEGGNHVPT